MVRPEVQRERLVQNLVGHIDHRALKRCAGIGGDDVDAAKALRDLRESRVDRLRVCQIADNREPAQLLRRSLQRLARDVEQRDLGAFRAKCLGDGKPEPAGGAGDDGDLAGQRLLDRLGQLDLFERPIFEVEQIGLVQRRPAADALGAS